MLFRYNILRRKLFLYFYLLIKVIHKKAPAIPRFVDKKKSIKQSYFLPELWFKKRNSMKMLRIDRLPCLNNQISPVLSRLQMEDPSQKTVLVKSV